jgi:hypothetical protein
MKYKVKRGITIDTKPVVVTIEDGQYVRDIKAQRFAPGDTITDAKLKNVNVKRLIAMGALEPIREADDAR